MKTVPAIRATEVNYDAPSIQDDTPIPGALADLNAERAVLGSLLLDPEAYYKISGTIKAGDFYRERHGWIFEAIAALCEQKEPADFTTVSNQLERHVDKSGRSRLEEIGGPAALTELITGTDTAIFVNHYAKIVSEFSTRRKLIEAANKIAAQVYSLTTPLPTVMEACEQAVFGVTGSKQSVGVRHIHEVVDDALDRIELAAQGHKPGLPTGFKMLDNILGGLQPSDLIIIAGRPGMGKSSLAATIAAHASQQFNARGLIFSIEMSSEQYIQRMLAMGSGIDSHRLRLGQFTDETEKDILSIVADILSQQNIWIDDTPAISLSELCSKARRIHAEHGLDYIVIDYLQLIVASSDNRRMSREQEISEVSRRLKALARELNVPIIALAQLSRSVEQRADKRPMLSDLRESGQIEQDADVILFIYREDYYIEDSDRQNIADILIAKHRHGATGTVSLYFRKELTQFKDLDIERVDFEMDERAAHDSAYTNEPTRMQ
jgi:replicative DNA helicase